ncbi:radical SAM/SPASM domain-containing protein [Longitalea arenae]|uniref:radical SAM/SPASM domain-containing protein n=1 Tax=Longitalea arenae TaxID=2812558 RepID=UPI0019680FF1|nr:radical SAM protein [Longitalea arenae]
MKASKFNIFFPHEDKIVGFNSYTSEYIVLEPMLYEMYDACFKQNSFDDLGEVHPAFYSFLCEKEFLVDETLDEIQRVKEYSYKIDNDETRYELHINPTMNCNFKCWYCYETHIKDSKMDQQTIDHTLKYVNNVFEQKKQLQQFSIGWFGGEPLLYYKKVVLPILEAVSALASERGITFFSSMTTNGLLINDETIETAKKYGLNFFQITLDGNREKHNKVRFISEGRGSYDQITANIVSLARAGLTVVVRINCSADTLNGINDIAADFSHVEEEARRFMTFDFHAVWQENEDLFDQLYETRVYFRQQGFAVESGSLNSVLNSCYGDHRNHATINYNGEVFKCTARDFTTQNSEGLLADNGTINWNEKLEKRLNSKFKNKPCLECAILPICGGGCTQQAVEHEGVDYCVNDFDETKKRKIVINKFLETLAAY